MYLTLFQILWNMVEIRHFFAHLYFDIYFVHENNSVKVSHENTHLPRTNHHLHFSPTITPYIKYLKSILHDHTQKFQMCEDPAYFLAKH